MASFDVSAIMRALGRDPHSPVRAPNNRRVKEYLVEKNITGPIASSVSMNELCYWTTEELDSIFDNLEATPAEIKSGLKSFALSPQCTAVDADFIQPTAQKRQLSADFLGALCVNKWGEFRVNPQEGYAALSHVWSQGLGSDDHNRGIHRSLLEQLFAKVESLGVTWIWMDSLAIPGGKRALSVAEEELKSMLINAMADIYRNATQVIIVDALMLRLDSTDPIATAALLSCSFWMTRVWTYQEIKLAVNSVIATKNGFVDFSVISETLKAAALCEAGEEFRQESPGRFPSLAKTFLRLQRHDDLGISLPDIAIGCGYREATENLDFARSLFPTLNISWSLNETLDTAMKKVYESQKRHAARLALYHGPPRAAELGWAPAVFPGLVDCKIIEAGIWKRRGMERSWLTSKIKSIVPSKPGALILELENGNAPGAYCMGFISEATKRESPKSVTEFENAVKEGTAYLLSDEPLIPKRHFSRVALLIERFLKPNNLEAWVCMTLAVGETEESYVAEKQTWLLLHENPVATNPSRSKGASELKFLLESDPKADFGRFLNNSIHGVARSGDVAELQRLLLHVDANCTDFRGWTPLHVAAATGQTDIISALVAAGSHLDVFTNNGESPLVLAVENGQIDAACDLISSGADINESHEKGFSPIVTAAMRGDLEAVSLLIAFGADVSKRDAAGWVPLLFAAQPEKDKILDILLEAGANTNVSGSSGLSALEVAIREEHTSAIRKLVAHGADLNDTRTSLPPLCHAIGSGSTISVEILLNAGAKATIVFNDGWTPLMLAAKVGNIDVGRLILQNDPSTLNYGGGSPSQTALRIASLHKKELFRRWLSESGAL